MSALSGQDSDDLEKLYFTFALMHDMELMSESLQQRFMCLEIKWYKTKRGKNLAVASVHTNQSICW